MRSPKDWEPKEFSNKEKEKWLFVYVSQMMASQRVLNTRLDMFSKRNMALYALKYIHVLFWTYDVWRNTTENRESLTEIVSNEGEEYICREDDCLLLNYNIWYAAGFERILNLPVLKITETSEKTLKIWERFLNHIPFLEPVLTEAQQSFLNELELPQDVQRYLVFSVTVLSI
jgi:hypothetical protein